MIDIKKAIQKLIKKIDLSEHETAEIFDQIMSGETTNAQIGAFLIALRLKGETVAEITGAAKIMRKK